MTVMNITYSKKVKTSILLHASAWNSRVCKCMLHIDGSFVKILDMAKEEVGEEQIKCSTHDELRQMVQT